MKKILFGIITSYFVLALLFSCQTSVSSEKIATIQGRVVELRGRNGEFHDPIAGATVSLLEYNASTITDSNGYFKLNVELSEKNASEIVTLLILKDGFDELKQEVAVEGGAVKEVGDLILNRSAFYGLITGKVITHDVQGNEVPLSNVEIEVTGHETIETTNAKGLFEIAYSLEPGKSIDTVEVILRKTNYIPDTLYNVVVKKDEVTDLGVITLQLFEKNAVAIIRGNIREIVDNVFEYALPGVEVSILETGETVYTDSLGRYEFTINIPENESVVERTLHFYKQYYKDQQQNFQLSGGDVVTYDVVMEPLDLYSLLKGVVIDTTGGTQTPIENATVRISGTQDVVSTNAQGEFSYLYKFPSRTTQTNLDLNFEKTGYEGVTISNVNVVADQIIDLGTIILTPKSDSTDLGGIGEPFYLEITNLESHHVYVKGSGLPEVTQLECTVFDNQGNPIDNNHATVVHFELLAGPGGGETLFPDSALTIDGKAITSIQAGTVAGAVQIRAWFRKDNGAIVQTEPIQVAIWGGLPDDQHFSLGVEKYNIAGMTKFGLIDKITAFVGDKYGNPAAPGTVVYFTTRWGYIEGSNPTDDLGRSTVSLLSASPVASEFFTTNQLRANPDSAITRIVAHTYDENQQKLVKYASVLFSAPTNQNIWVDTLPPADYGFKERTTGPLTFTYNVTNKRSQTFYFQVCDIYGNPLVGGTKILVYATDGGVSGDVNVTIPDALYPGPGTTEFSFTWNLTTGEVPQTVGITISVEPPASEGNGSASVQIIGNLQ